jgi:hypothetical protein
MELKTVLLEIELIRYEKERESVACDDARRLI